MNLKDFEQKYITDYSYVKTAWDIKSDYDFLSELVNRNSKSVFDFDLTLTKHGDTHGWFLKALWREQREFTEKSIARFLLIYEITCKVFEQLDHQNLDVTDLVQWYNFVLDAWNFNILDHLGSFVGSSHQHEAIDDALAKFWFEA